MEEMPAQHRRDVIHLIVGDESEIVGKRSSRGVFQNHTVPCASAAAMCLALTMVYALPASNLWSLRPSQIHSFIPIQHTERIVFSPIAVKHAGLSDAFSQ